MKLISTIIGHRTAALTSMLLLSLGLSLGAPRQALALTIVLDFTTSAMTDMYGVKLKAADYSAFGFSLNTTQIQSSLLSAITEDFLGYPSFADNVLSPLPAGKELNINFEISTGKTLPLNKDPNYYYFAIGNRNGGTETYFGHACLSCVRSASGTYSSTYQGRVVGAVLVDNIDNLASLANTDQKRINLLAGTISHEIGHSLSLEHPSGTLTNPGDSLYSLVATGASPSNMPNAERVKDRDFSYSEYSQLISAVGLRDIQAIPEPSSLAMLLVGLALTGMVRTRRSSART